MDKFFQVYNKLDKHFGFQNWWPVISDNPKLEISIGAILTQNTSWLNVEKCIKALNDKNLLDREKLKPLKDEELALLIRSSGYNNQKAKKIKLFLNFSREITRENLLSIWGIGKETADSILLYAYNQPNFVIDAYTKRIFSRLGLIKEDLDYDEIKSLFENNLEKDVKLYKQYHALIVEHAKRYCRKKPLCKLCPLSNDCSYFKDSSLTLY